jgi:hypothetical protein
MTGHREDKPRRDRARAERMRARIASAPDEFQALGAAYDWLRMELKHLERAGTGTARTQRHTGQAAEIARRTMRELVARTESIIEATEKVGDA